MMPLQRACGAESRARNKLSNGPLRAQSKTSVKYSATCGHTSVAGGMLVLRQAHGVIAVNQGGTADKCLFVLDRVYISVKDVFFFQDSFDSNKSPESFPIKEVKHHVVDETMAKLNGFCS